jgi:5-methylcytosine-specific restriction endonuclease McrA
MCRSHYQMAWRRSAESWRAEPKVNAGSCSVEDCDKPARKRTWCHMHYQRWKLHGDVNRGRVVEPSCTHCGAEKFRNASGKLYCKACASRICREWRERDPEATRERARATYERRREAHQARCREYYRENREAIDAQVRQWQAANADRVRGYKRNWISAHPEKGREYASRRRALKLAAVCEHGINCVTAELLSSIPEQECAYCGAPARDGDHVVPLARGGLHCRDNLVPACSPCNKSKGSRLLSEWKREAV